MPSNQQLIVNFNLTSRPAKGLGAESAPDHKDGPAPGDAPVAGDSYTSTSGVQAGTNQPGEKGNVGAIVGEKPMDHINQGNQK